MSPLQLWSSSPPHVAAASALCERAIGIQTGPIQYIIVAQVPLPISEVQGSDRQTTQTTDHCSGSAKSTVVPKERPRYRCRSTKKGKATMLVVRQI